MSLRRDVTRGIFWVGVAQISSKAVGFVVQVILARILLPTDFGLVAIAYLALDSLTLFAELGFTSALIYRKDRVQEAAATAFTMVVLAGLVISVAGVLTAPTMAWFFKDVRVAPLLRALSATMLLASFGQVPLSLLAKEMDFKKRFAPMVVPGIGSGLVAVICALSGMGVWSLVAGRIADAALTSVLSYAVSQWRPSFRWDRKLAGELFDYGKHIIGSQLLIFGITNIDNMFVGRILAPADLGVYNQAYNLSNLPATQITRIIGQVMFPAFSKLQDDSEKMRRAFFQTMRYVSLLSIPISIAMIAFAGDFIFTIYTDKWAAAVVPLQILGIYGLIRSVAANMGNIFKAGGKPKWLTYIALWRLITMLLFLYPATKYYGIIGVSTLSAAVSIVDFLISAALVNRIVHARAMDYVRTLGPILGVSLVAAVVARFAEAQFHAVPHARIAFLTALLIMVTVYVGGMWIIDRELRERVRSTIREYSPIPLAGVPLLGDDQVPK